MTPPGMTAIERLQQAARMIEASQDAAERGTVLADLLTHHTPELAKLYRTRDPRFEAELIRMRGIRGMPEQLKRWIRPIKHAAKEQQRELDAKAMRAAPAELAGLDDLTEGLGVAGLLTPPGYTVSPAGVWCGDDQVSNAPVIVTGVTNDLETESVMLDLAWRYRGQWRRRSVLSTIARDARKIIALVEWAFPVESDKTAEMVRYLNAFIHANGDLIPQRTTTRRMGWLAPRVFQLGERCYGADHSLLSDGGLEDLGNAFRPRGDWATWRNAIRRHLKGRPMVQLAVYASAAAPLLTVLEIDGFVMDWSGTTSRGKTSALRVAASVWGDPLTVMASWDTASSVGPQERAAFLHSLPLIMDDTQLQKDRKEVVSNMLYSIPGGQERVKGKADGGLRRTKKWRTIMLSSGEKSVISFADDAAGVRARTLCIIGTPFGKDTRENRESVEALMAALRGNNGHLGPMLIQHLVDNCNYSALRERYRVLQAGYAATAGGSVSRRLSASVACLALTAELLHELGLPGQAEMQRALDVAWAAAQQSGADSDRPRAAMQSLYNWCTSNRALFFGAPGSPSKDAAPMHGWAGAWDLSSTGTWRRLEIYPSRATEVLERAGFDVKYVIEEWKRRDFLESSGEKPPRHKIKSKLITGRPRLYVFTPESVGGILDDPS